MRKSTVSLTITAVLVLATAILVTSCPESLLRAQGRSSKQRGPSVKAIDVQAKKIQQSFIRETAELAAEYEDAGRLERSKELLQTILKLDKDVPGVKEKIKELEENILSSNENDMEIEVGQGWVAAGRVFKGREIRIQSTGTYRFIVNTSVGTSGFPTKDVKKDMAPGVPCGALMGLVMSKDKLMSKDDPGNPFPVGAEREFKPKEDGILFFRMNLPPGHNCNGRVKVRMSGYIRPQR